MARGIAPIPLMLSLEATAILLVAAGAGASAAAVPGGMDAIRLPTDNVRGEATWVLSVPLLSVVLAGCSLLVTRTFDALYAPYHK
ncbi:unnamed protein product [Urochloa humidicola]